MTKKNLIPINERPEEEAKKLQAKGGRRKSPRKTYANTLNGLKNNKKLTKQQQLMLAALRDHRFVDVIIGLISLNLEHIHDSKIRNSTIDQLQRMLPNRNVNINAEVMMEDNPDKDRVVKMFFEKKNIPLGIMNHLNARDKNSIVTIWEMELLKTY